MNIQQIETKVIGVKKLNNSINGNPNFRIHTKDGVVKTPVDSTLSYKYTYSNFVGSNVIINYELNKKAEAILTNIIKVYY